MAEEPTDFVLKLRSGRTVLGNRGYIGINNDLDISEGYDREISDYCEEWTPHERIDLANHMIALWTKCRNEA